VPATDEPLSRRHPTLIKASRRALVTVRNLRPHLQPLTVVDSWSPGVFGGWKSLAVQRWTRAPYGHGAA